MTEKLNNENPHELRKVSPFLVLPEGVSVSTFHDEGADRTVIQYDEPQSYPDFDNSSSALRSMLLKKSDVGDDSYVMPRNYITLGQALNDAAGGVGVERGEEASRLLLGELGKGLGSLVREGFVPRDLNYLNVVFSRYDSGAKLMPPLELIDFDPHEKSDAREYVISSLLASLQEGATGPEQERLLSKTYGDFVKGFDS